MKHDINLPITRAKWWIVILCMERVFLIKSNVACSLSFGRDTSIFTESTQVPSIVIFCEGTSCDFFRFGMKPTSVSSLYVAMRVASDLLYV